MCSDKPRLHDAAARAVVKSGLASIRYVLRRHSLLEKHTSVLVGVSGGIDSLVLLFLLHKYKALYRQMWHINACHIDTGFPDWSPVYLRQTLAIHGIELTIVKTEIYRRIRNVDDKCFICSRQRRKKLMETAEGSNIINIALAHHQEDVAETMLLNMFYAGRMSTLIPRQPIVHSRFFLIRPLYYLNKQTIIQIGRALGLKSERNHCPYYKHSRRELIRELIYRIKEKNPDIYTNIFHSIFNIKQPYLPH